MSGERDGIRLCIYMINGEEHLASRCPHIPKIMLIGPLAITGGHADTQNHRPLLWILGTLNTGPLDIVRRQKAKKGPEVEVEYVQTFIAVYCSLGCVPQLW